MGVKWDLILFSIFIFPMSNDVAKVFFISLLAFSFILRHVYLNPLLFFLIGLSFCCWIARILYIFKILDSNEVYNLQISSSILYAVLKDFIIYFLIKCVCVCVSMNMCVDAWGSQKKASEPELQVVVSCPNVGACMTESRSFTKQLCFNHWASHLGDQVPTCKTWETNRIQS